MHRDDTDLLRAGFRRGRWALAASLKRESEQHSNEQRSNGCFPIGHSQPFP
jgi:hypothetical protein